MLDEERNPAVPSDNEIEFLKNTKGIRIERMSEHYGEY